MATIKIACPECGQKVSGDESFLGTSVNCPLCNTRIQFPDQMPGESPAREKEQGKGDEPAAKGSPREAAAKPASSMASPAAAAPPAAARLPTAAAPPPAAKSPAASRSPAAPPAGTPAVPKVPVVASPDAAAAPREKAPAPTSKAALLSLVFGIAGLVLCPIGILFAVPAILAGHSARSAFQSSRKRLGGQSYATAGLALGYLYVAALFIGMVFVPWKAFIAFGEQRWNSESAAAILTALNHYASDHGGQYPGALAELAPSYLSAEKLEAGKYIEPGSLPPKRLDYQYHAGRKSGEDPRTIVLSAPDSDKSYRRLVGYLDGSVEILPEDEFIRRTIR